MWYIKECCFVMFDILTGYTDICVNLLLLIYVCIINIISIEREWERLPIETTSATLCGIFSKENVENLLRKSLPRENFIPQTTSEGDKPALRWTNIWQKLLSTVNKYLNIYLIEIMLKMEQIFDRNYFPQWTNILIYIW